jgi:hypothetical protein
LVVVCKSMGVVPGHPEIHGGDSKLYRGLGILFLALNRCIELVLFKGKLILGIDNECNSEVSSFLQILCLWVANPLRA